MIMKSPLSFPKPSFPILLLHQEEEDVRETERHGRHNPAQAASAISVILEMLKKLPTGCRIVVLCLYTAEKERMHDQLRKHGITCVKVKSVDGFQANESDLVYILTTRSTPEAVDGQVLEFIQDERRATVAVSRARHGIVLHGNLNTLCVGNVWKSFMCEALKETQVVSPKSYLNALCNVTEPETLPKPSWSFGETETQLILRTGVSPLTPPHTTF